MEALVHLGEQEKRQLVAGWIQNSVRPVAKLLSETTPVDIDDEIVEEATEFEVREYQLDAWANLWQARQEGKDSGLIHLATGLGKTSVAVFDVMKFREEFKARHGREPWILFASHKEDINEQAAERFAAFMPDLEQGFIDGKRKTFGDITFATLQSLYAGRHAFDPEDFDYIIYDEAHHAKADTFEAVVNHFKPAFQLALTATPDRMDGANIRELFGEALYSKGLAEALAEGLLAEPDYHIVFDDAVKQAMQSGFEADTIKELQALFGVKPRNEIIAKNIKDEMEKIGLKLGDDKTILFCKDIDHAEEMADLLGGAAYHSERPKAERKLIFDDFKEGHLKVICTVDMFNEGIDIPDAQLLVFLRSTSSQTIFEQQLGRGLRKHKGKDRVAVLDFVANVERIAMIMELAKEIEHLRPKRDDTLPRQAGGAGRGLHISTSHAEFDFDRMAVDILSKFEAFKNKLVRSGELNKLSNEGAILLAKDLSPDKPLTVSKLSKLSKNGEFLSTGTIIKRFGSITNFQKACGFNVVERPDFRDMSNEEVIVLARDLSPDRALNKMAIQRFSEDGAFPSVPAIMKRFGSITEFQKACKFKVRDRNAFRAIADDKDAITQLALKISPDQALTPGEIDRLSGDGDFVSRMTVVKAFGSVSEFQKACGFEVESLSSLSNNALVGLALRLSPDKPLTTPEMEKLSKDGEFMQPRSISMRFGTISNFQRACGFETRDLNTFKGMSNEELISLALERSPKKALTKSEMVRLSKDGLFPSDSFIIKRFGTMAGFREACGFEDKNLAALSNEELIALALELSPDEKLTTGAMNQFSKEGSFVSPAYIHRRFGSITEFQRRCGF